MPTAPVADIQFTCFTTTKVQILTPELVYPTAQGNQLPASSVHDRQAEAGGDTGDLGVLEAVRELVAAVTACVPSAKAEAEPLKHAEAKNVVVQRPHVWSAMPSVLTWASGARERSSGWQEEYERRYVSAMEQVKLEAVPGLAQTHVYLKTGTIFVFVNFCTHDACHFFLFQFTLLLPL